MTLGHFSFEIPDVSSGDPGFLITILLEERVHDGERVVLDFIPGFVLVGFQQCDFSEDGIRRGLTSDATPLPIHFRHAARCAKVLCVLSASQMKHHARPIARERSHGGRRRLRGGSGE